MVSPMLYSVQSTRHSACNDRDNWLCTVAGFNGTIVQNKNEALSPSKKTVLGFAIVLHLSSHLHFKHMPWSVLKILPYAWNTWMEVFCECSTDQLAKSASTNMNIALRWTELCLSRTVINCELSYWAAHVPWIILTANFLLNPRDSDSGNASACTVATLITFGPAVL